MIVINSLDVNGIIFTGIQIELPGTKIFFVMNEIGYIISTTIGIYFSNETYFNENVICGVASNVNTLDELLDAPLEKMTDNAKQYGWSVGMRTKEALLKIS